ncbi:MAG: MFS transporter [Ginsengibacter sp.]|jgi:MFS family permease
MYNKRFVFWAACIGILFFGMAITTLGSVVPDLRERFQLNEISSGTLFSILPLGLLTGSLFFGPFCDRYGYRVLLALACISMFLGFEGIAYAPTHFVLKVSVFLFGLGGGAINGAASALVSDISEKDKGANLSLLGVFFAIGALGMPFILGVLKGIFTYQTILSIVGIATFLVAVFYLSIRFPPAKQAASLPLNRYFSLLTDKTLLLIGFFLFFQSAFEGIINNWTTTYLMEVISIEPQKALYALSLSVVGMTVMRLLLGSVFRNTALKYIWSISFSLLFFGLIFMSISNTFFGAVTGLFLVGAGLAAGFPIMLGVVGHLYKELSGTAFSVVFVMALTGNMLINYGVGFIFQFVGVRHLVTVGFIELLLMGILCLVILKRTHLINKT